LCHIRIVGTLPKFSPLTFGSIWAATMILFLFCISLLSPFGQGCQGLSGKCEWRIVGSKFSCLGNDPQPDPQQEKSRWRQWSRQDMVATKSGEKTAERTRKRPLDFQRDIRDQEAVGSNPVTRTKTPAKSLDFAGVLLRFVPICICWNCADPRADPHQENFRSPVP